MVAKTGPPLCPRGGLRLGRGTAKEHGCGARLAGEKGLRGVRVPGQHYAGELSSPPLHSLGDRGSEKLRGSLPKVKLLVKSQAQT